MWTTAWEDRLQLEMFLSRQVLATEGSISMKWHCSHPRERASRPTAPAEGPHGGQSDARRHLTAQAKCTGTPRCWQTACCWKSTEPSCAGGRHAEQTRDTPFKAPSHCQQAATHGTNTCLHTGAIATSAALQPGADQPQSSGQPCPAPSFSRKLSHCKCCVLPLGTA